MLISRTLIFITSWLLMLLGTRLGFGLTMPGLIITLAAALVLALMVKPNGASHVSGRRWPSLAGCILLALVYLARPGEQIAGNWDPGVYLAQGAASSDKSGWTLPDSAADVLDHESRRVIYPRQRGQTIKVPGFYAPLSPDQEGLVPQFLPLYPALLSAAHLLGGWQLMIRMDGLCFLLSAIILADLARRISRREGAAILVILLFGLQPATIWFARFHTVESITLLLYSALLWAAYGVVTRHSWTATCITCASILLIPWSTPSAWPLILLLPLLVLAQNLTAGQRVALATATTLGLATIWWFIEWTGHPYAHHLLLLAPGRHRVLYAAKALWPSALVLGLAAAGLILAKPHLARVRSLTTPWGWLSAVISVTLAAALLQPRLLPHYPHFVDGVMALAPLPLMVWALLGIAVTCARGEGRVTWIAWVLASTLLITITFIEWPSIPRMYPWAWKRWIWILLPATALMASLGITFLAGRLDRGRNLASAIAAGVVMIGPWLSQHPLSSGREWAGLYDWMRHLSASLPAEAIVIAPRELAMPLEFHFGHLTVPLYQDTTGKRDQVYQSLWEKASLDQPVVVVAEKRPGWIPQNAAPPRIHPDYKGSWIMQNKRPAQFVRQPRGFHVLLWSTNGDNGADQGARTGHNE